MPTKIFLCHDRTDSLSCSKLMNNLRPAQENALLTLWSSHHAAPGDEVPRYVATNLEDTDLVLLLLTPDLLGSEYFWSTELSAVLERHRAERVKLIPILLRSCTWEECLPTQGLRHIPSDEQPLIAQSPELTDHRMAEAAREILTVVRAMRPNRRPVTRVTPISELNASLRKLRAEAAEDPNGNLDGLMELKQRLRYGDADGKDPSKRTREIPHPQLIHLLSASKHELSTGSGPSSTTAATRDWRDERIAELEAVLADRDWQLAAGVARFNSTDVVGTLQGVNQTARLREPTKVGAQDLHHEIAAGRDLGSAIGGAGAPRLDDLSVVRPVSEPPPAIGVTLPARHREAAEEKSTTQQRPLGQLTSMLALGAVLLAGTGAMAYLGAGARLQAAAHVESPLPAQGASSARSVSNPEPGSSMQPASGAQPAVGAPPAPSAPPAQSAREAPSSQPASAVSAEVSPSPSPTGPSAAGSTRPSASVSASVSASPARPPARPVVTKRPLKTPLISTSDPFGPAFPDGL